MGRVVHTVDEKRVLIEGETMANSSGPKENGIKQVLVGITSITKRLSSVEEERNFNPFLNALLFKPEEFWKQIFQRSTWVLLADQIITGDQMWVCEFDCNTSVHVLHDLSGIESADT